MKVSSPVRFLFLSPSPPYDFSADSLSHKFLQTFFQVAPEFLNLLQIAKVANKVLQIKQSYQKGTQHLVAETICGG